MFWYAIFGFFAAFGVFCAVWALFGQLLPASTGCHVYVICSKDKEIPVLRRFCWLRELGMTRCELIMINSSLNRAQRDYIRNRYPYIHFTARHA